MLLAALLYLSGGLAGTVVVRHPTVAARLWPLAIRTQTVVVACALGVVAGWRLHAFEQLLVPVGIELTLVVVLMVALATRGSASPGEAALWSWSATANTSFWTIPLATGFAGPTGAVLAVLTDRLAAARTAVTTHLLRRDAPIEQRRPTAWVDQMPIGALVVGLALHALGSAPSWTDTLANVAGPSLAFTGAALFFGSITHDLHRQVAVTRADTVRVLGLLAVRVGLAVPILIWCWGSARAVIVALSACSVPAFLPAQLSILYGYRTGVVRAAARWGWPLGALGLVLAALAR